MDEAQSSANLEVRVLVLIESLSETVNRSEGLARGEEAPGEATHYSSYPQHSTSNLNISPISATSL